jgi:NADH-quinone oxidoreductase subunit B
VTILDVGLACCALEVGAAITAGLLVPQVSIDTDFHDSVVSVLLISGTVTDALAPGVIRAWAALEEPRLAVSFGACANTGGPYWDAPTVTKGIDQLIPISVYIPGCPPRPEALVAGLVRLAQPCVLTLSDPRVESR